MKKFSILLAIIFIMASIFAIGCGDDDDDASPASPATGAVSTPLAGEGDSTTGSTLAPTPEATSPDSTPETPDTPDTQETPDTPGIPQELMDIFGKAEDRGPVRYEVVTETGMTDPMTMLVWEKDGKSRMEMSGGPELTILLTDAEAMTSYTYMPNQNMAILMNYEDATDSATDQADAVLDFNPQIVGEETIDNKSCIVVEYDLPEEAGINEKAKMWIWEEYGFPIRMEIPAFDGTTMIMQITNIEFIDIDDSMFELPEGVEVTDMGALIPQLPEME